MHYANIEVLLLTSQIVTEAPKGHRGNFFIISGFQVVSLTPT